jgi:deoxyribose-phosphate aldolase
VFEAKDAISKGATEIDMVANIGKIKDQDFDYVKNEIAQIKKDGVGNKVLKVIIETALLTEDEIRKTTQAVVDAKADFVKTSTGFSTRGASFDDVKIMKEVVGDKILIKAAGGVKTADDMIKMVELGANRIGTSRGVDLIKGTTSNKEGY